MKCNRGEYCDTLNVLFFCLNNHLHIFLVEQLIVSGLFRIIHQASGHSYDVILLKV